MVTKSKAYRDTYICDRSTNIKLSYITQYLYHYNCGIYSNAIKLIYAFTGKYKKPILFFKIIL